MNRRFPRHVSHSGLFADGLIVVSGLLLVLLAVVAVFTSMGTTAQNQEAETPPAVNVQRDLQPEMDAAAVTPELTQQRLSDWLDRALRREERAIRRKVIC
jgi:hypothetical protein